METHPGTIMHGEILQEQSAQHLMQAPNPWQSASAGAPSLSARLCSGLTASWKQAALMAVILALTSALARIGLSSVARPMFVLSGFLTAAFYIRRSPWSYLTITLWFWTLTPLARRLIDYNSSFDAVNYVLATPNLMTLFMLKDVLGSRDLLRKPESIVGLLSLLPVLYGLGVSLVQGDVVPGLIASADWVAPMIYYFFFIVNWHCIRDAEHVFNDFLSANGLFIVSYGIVQYFGALPWDAAWVLNANMSSIGKPVAYELRVFGTLNAPGVLAIWIGTTLLLFLHFRTRLTALLVPSAVLLLLMTQVRSVAGTVLMGLAVAALAGRSGTFKGLGRAVLAIVLVVCSMSLINPTMAEHIWGRLDTLNNLGEDSSALARESIYNDAPSIINANPLGLGIGALGRGAVATHNDALVSVDSGPLAIYIALGWVAGSIYLAGIVLALVQAMIAARSTRSAAALALAVAAIAGAASLPFTGMGGFYAAIVWICAGYAATIGIATRTSPSEWIRHA